MLAGSACSRFDGGRFSEIDAGMLQDGATVDAGVLQDGATQDAGHVDAAVCVPGPEDSPDHCSDDCSNDGDTWADCEDFDCCAVDIDCPATSACGMRRVDGGVSSRTDGGGGSEVDLPELADPERESARFECEGEPMTAADVLSYAPQGTGFVWFVNGRDFSGSGRSFNTTEVYRRCNDVTGCTSWATTGTATWDFQVGFAVDPSGALSLVELDGAEDVLERRVVEAADAQMVFNGPVPARVSRPDDAARKRRSLCVDGVDRRAVGPSWGRIPSVRARYGGVRAGDA